MSAFMVNEDTLDLIASASTWGNRDLFLYVTPGTLPPRGELSFPGEGESVCYKAGDRKDIKEELRLENMASLWARYPNHEHNTESEPFKNIFSDQATYAQALGALACYEYQACESDQWRESYAYAICQAIRRNLCALISAGEWEYERPAGLAQRVSLLDMINGQA
jgi:hypothetical protein